jgi:hypothetical protein
MLWFVPGYGVVRACLSESVVSSLSQDTFVGRSLQAEQLMKEEVLEGTKLESWLTPDNFDAGSLNQLTTHLWHTVDGPAAKLSGN